MLDDVGHVFFSDRDDLCTADDCIADDRLDVALMVPRPGNLDQAWVDLFFRYISTQPRGGTVPESPDPGIFDPQSFKRI